MCLVFTRAIIVLLCLLPGLAARTNTYFEPPDDTRFLAGRFVYQRNCVACHGARGDGQGEMGVTLQPRPRDFRSGTFKYRSTPSGTLPSTDDLMRTIRQGISGTAMPTFAALREHEIRAVIEYIKALSPKWEDPGNFAAPMPIPDLPEWFRNPAALSNRADKGRALFQTMCAPCHGPTGSGEGFATIGEGTDSWGHPVRPADLRQTELRNGRELRDIYRVLVTGLNGTPMPSFEESTTVEQRWDIVAFIQRLRSEASAGTGSGSSPQ